METQMEQIDNTAEWNANVNFFLSANVTLFDCFINSCG